MRIRLLSGGTCGRCLPERGNRDEGENGNADAPCGTPDQCIANIQRLQEQGIDYFGCNFAFSRMEHDKVMRAMQLFATEVMPHFI